MPSAINGVLAFSIRTQAFAIAVFIHASDLQFLRASTHIGKVDTDGIWPSLFDGVLACSIVLQAFTIPVFIPDVADVLHLVFRSRIVRTLMRRPVQVAILDVFAGDGATGVFTGIEVARLAGAGRKRLVWQSAAVIRAGRELSRPEGQPELLAAARRAGQHRGPAAALAPVLQRQRPRPGQPVAGVPLERSRADVQLPGRPADRR